MSSRPIVFLHGFLGSGEDFAQVAAGLTELGRTHAPNLPGHGADPAPLPVTDFAAGVDVVRAQLAALAPPPFHLVGYSLGGRLGLALAARHPEMVASVTAIGASGGIADATERARRRDADHALAERLAHGDFAAFLREWYDQELFAGLRRSEAFAAVLARRSRGDPRALARALRTFGVGEQPPLHDELRRTDVPALLIAGARDGKYADLNARLAAGWPRARCQVIQGAGHSVHLESPIALARALASFLRDQEHPNGVD
jgi:2-succinyl-6-hydroxy-2,4-cyclohexadiene-1-carboxylate synthase